MRRRREKTKGHEGLWGLRGSGGGAAHLVPSSTRLTKAVRAHRTSLPPLSAEALMRSFKCCGQRPSGPPAHSLGKERMTWTNSTSDTGMVGACPLGGGGVHESGYGGGCLDRRAARVALSNPAMESSEQMRRTAAL